MRVVASLLLLLPLAASAEASAPEPPRWNLGAGVSVWTVSTLPGPVVIGPGVSYAYLGASTPAVTASIERAVGERSWLVVGFAGSIERSRSDAYPGATQGFGSDTRALSLELGLRQVVTGAAAPVAVSVVALASGGIADVSYPTDTAGTVTGQRAYSAAASGGIALDRELTGGLSVRVATQLAGVRWQRSQVDTSTAGTLRATAFAFEVFLAPRLELRLAF